MSEQNEDDSYEQMLMMYTRADEQPESLREAGIMDVPANTTEQEHEDSESEVLDVVYPPHHVDPASLPLPDSSTPSNAGHEVMLTSLLARFSLAQFSFPQPGPYICPRDLSPIPGSPLSLVASPVDVLHNLPNHGSAPKQAALLPGKCSRMSSLHATSDGERRKARKKDDENSSVWEQRMAPRHRDISTPTTSRRSGARRASTTHPASTGRPRRTTRERKVMPRGGLRSGGATAANTDDSLHPSRHDGLPASEFTFENTLRSSEAPACYNASSATVAHAQLVSSRHSPMEVDDMMSPLSDCSRLTLPPPTERHDPTTNPVSEDNATLPDIPGVRKSKIHALRCVTKGASLSRTHQRAQPLTSPLCLGTRHHAETSWNAQIDEEASDYCTADTDGAAADDEKDADFAPSHQPPRVRRKARTANERRQRQRRAGRKATSSRSAKDASIGPTYVTAGGEKRVYARPGDCKRKNMKKVYGPVWCLFCTETGPGPDDRSPYSRVRDSPKRHLANSCEHFPESEYYRAKKAKGKSHAQIMEIAAKERKIAGSIICCPHDPRQRARLVKEKFTHAEVVAELTSRSTVYKDKNCRCCPWPHFSKFRREL